MKSARPSARTAFTVPELLAVVAVIAIVLSLLLPSMQQARINMKRTLCLTNQRSLVVGLQNYTIENASLFPTPFKAGQDWADAYGLRDDYPYTGAANRAPLGLGLLVSTGLIPSGNLGDLIHCPTFNNLASTVAPGHCMDVATPTGYGGSAYNTHPKHRIIGSYNYRGTSFYWVNKRVMRKSDVNSNSVMMIDTPDFRFRGRKSEFNEHGGYNIVYADGSGNFFADQEYLIDGLAESAGGRVDGRGVANNDELIYKRLGADR